MSDQQALYRLGIRKDDALHFENFGDLVERGVLVPVEPDLYIFGEPVYCPTLTDAQQKRFKGLLGFTEYDDE